jgi:hypothetical protein
MNRYLLCVLLLSLSAFADARDVRMHGPNGDGGSEACPVPAASPPALTRQTSTTTSHGKAKTPPLFRGGDDDAGPHAPRWHSFLPGMFR